MNRSLPVWVVVLVLVEIAQLGADGYAYSWYQQQQKQEAVSRARDVEAALHKGEDNVLQATTKAQGFGYGSLPVGAATPQVQATAPSRQSVNCTSTSYGINKQFTSTNCK